MEYAGLLEEVQKIMKQAPGMGQIKYKVITA